MVESARFEKAIMALTITSFSLVSNNGKDGSRGSGARGVLVDGNTDIKMNFLRLNTKGSCLSCLYRMLC